MAAFRKYFLIFIFILSGVSGCKKDINTNPSPSSPYITASCNNTFVAFTGTVKVVSSEYTINGTSSANSTLQIAFGAPSIGTYKLGFGQAIFTSPNGESWQTTTSDTGTVYVSALSSNSITGSFSFYADETRPTLGASLLTVNGGTFYLTW
jgi:hypothetical protein